MYKLVSKYEMMSTAQNVQLYSPSWDPIYPGTARGKTYIQSSFKDPCYLYSTKDMET